MEATARTYRYLDAAEIAEQRKASSRQSRSTGQEMSRAPASHPRAGRLMLAALLVGCSAEHEELREWMEQQRREVKPSISPMQPPKKFDPQPYTSAQAVEPFSQQKLTVALKQEARQPNSLLSAELNRRKEPLEAYPLDSMSMVGSVNKQGQALCLLRVDALLYQVKVGDYLGQNYGRITKIDETEIAMREIVQDAAGEWIERPATLQLQERAR
jgi:type IV pilus assembly protein PilP